MRPSLLLVCVLFFAIPFALAGEAKSYSVKATNAGDIVSDRDHFDVIFVSGWVSQKDSSFQKLLSKNHKATADINASGTYFDGEQLKNAWIIENSDIPGNKLDRPWGVTDKVLLSAIPSDTVVANIVVKFELYKDDRIKQALGVFQGAEPAVGAAVQPYLTYANLIDSFFTTFFGTDKTQYPFLMDTGVSDASVKSADGMYEHYLIGISPNQEGDTWLASLDSSKLAYDSSVKVLRYNGQPVSDHTFAVFLIQKAPNPDIQKLTYESNAPWAALALGTFYQAPLPSVTKKDDIASVEKTYIKNLGDCTGLLKRELRFSAYDRASALRAFATSAKQAVAAGCAQGGVPASDCKTPQLDNFISQIAVVFGLSSSSKQSLANDSLTLNDKIRVMVTPH